MKITIEGTQEQLLTFFKALASNGNSTEILTRLAEAGVLTTEAGNDNEAIYQALEDLSWETIYLAHLIFLRGDEDAKGKFMSCDQLKNIPYTTEGDKMSERSMSARVGGAKKVSKRHKLKNNILDIKLMPGREKRFYLSADVITTFEQYLEQENAHYKAWLESGDEYIYPSV
jgi:hypothetical protein